jgi:hypothetical protein
VKIMTQDEINARVTEFIARVNETVTEAEKHLEVPQSTISSIPDDPDFIATVKAYAVVEPMLNELIAKQMTGPDVPGITTPGRDEIYASFVVSLNMSGRAGKLRLAEELGLLTKERVVFIEALSRVRNRYAHNVKNMHRSLVEILTEEQQSNKQIVNNLTGIDLSLSSSDDQMYLKFHMYWRLADYLADALHILRPPPLPSGGLLGALFTEPPKAGASESPSSS